MLGKELLTYVDHTNLKPTATWADIETLCKEAMTYHTASVCIPPSFVKAAYEAFGHAVTICTVIGFPNGYMTAAAKVAETKEAVQQGAKEIDMVINLGWVKEARFDTVLEDIRSVKEACGEALLKVIIETCYLTEEEKVALCKVVTDSGAEYIKTSTGFGSAGATLEDVHLMKAHIGPHVKIKAAGGIRTVEDMVAYVQAGCSRIGASAAVSALAHRLEESF